MEFINLEDEIVKSAKLNFLNCSLKLKDERCSDFEKSHLIWK